MAISYTISGQCVRPDKSHRIALEAIQHQQRAKEESFEEFLPQFTVLCHVVLRQWIGQKSWDSSLHDMS